MPYRAEIRDGEEPQSFINSFEGSFEFLSNFYPAPVKLFDIAAMSGEEYPTVEHAFQAAKTDDLAERVAILRAPTPGRAKRLGQRVKKRADWEQVKEAVMLRLLRQKFHHAALRAKLLATGDAVLIEGNWWGDTYWGICKGRGQNRLGALLMQVRKEIVDAAGQ